MPFDSTRAARQADPILGEFFGGTTSLSQAQIDWLLSKGVSPSSLGRDADGGGMVIGAADVVVAGELFDWSEEEDVLTSSSLVFVARDRAGDPLDLVAWSPRTNDLATRFGRAPVLGERSLYSLHFDGPPRIHRGIMAWLRAGRDGIVIVDPQRAGRVLIDLPDRLVAEDEAHAAEIAAIMTATVDLARIICPQRRAA